MVDDGRGVSPDPAPRVRQVRFDTRARPVCETRVTVENGDVRLRWGDDWMSAALQQLRDDIRERL